MAKRPYYSGARASKVAKFVWRCTECGVWHQQQARPAACKSCECPGLARFHSTAEAQRYAQLLLFERAGQIKDLELQPVFTLHAYERDASGFPTDKPPVKLGRAIMDFGYTRCDTGDRIIEDVKGGPGTALSAWKRLHTETEYGIKVHLT